MNEIKYFRRQAWGKTVYRITEPETLIASLAGIGRKAEECTWTTSQWNAWLETMHCVTSGQMPTLTEVADPKLSEYLHNIFEACTNERTNRNY